MTGAGAVTPPFLVSWNLTRRCGLACSHCYLDSSEISGSLDSSTEEAFSVIDELSGFSPGAMLILTGGEPLLRPDIFDIAGRASSRGLTPVVGTSGALLDSRTVRRLKASGVMGVGVSLDSATPGFHDRFRGMNGAWQKTVDGMASLASEGLDFQVQFTVMRENRAELPGVIRLAGAAGARALNVFFLVCTGRGERKTDLTPGEYEETLRYVVGECGKKEGRMMVRARCAPHILRIAAEKDPESPLLKGSTAGCIAARGYMRIDPEGRITACPYMPPDANSPVVGRDALSFVYGKDPVFTRLREARYGGRCGACEHRELCGGCRARALASTGDPLAEDPICTYEPDANAARKKPSCRPAWSAEAAKRLESVPAFLRPMVRGGVERYAAMKGLSEITPEIMAELRRRTGR